MNKGDAILRLLMEIKLELKEVKEQMERMETKIEKIEQQNRKKQITEFTIRESPHRTLVRL
ncbi:hypothetical protein CN899_29835 [Bacillus thuringiensis]|uniref:Uncharacterized protein n=1 Tax=Bacillus thuringiensis TaxID=1428 RepID=A0A9X7GG60_BACTU|nr:hypothetical protein [Bacillus thuringiensis]PGH77223.1 hypothetical protein CN899_29835 [Bacillus thuringiensis]